MNKYSTLKNDHLENHLSNFIVPHLSYSSLRSFQRNELAYERSYIFKIYGLFSASSLAGSAYHFALENYFKKLQNKEKLPGLAELSAIGFGLIDLKNKNELKLNKNHQNTDDVKTEASEKFRKLILNFLGESDTYLDDIDEVLFVEERFETFLTLAGWDCPLPFVFVSDLIYRNKKREIVVLDHKGKTAYTSADEAILTASSQAIVNAKGFESATLFDPRLAKLKGEKVSKFFYLENKISKNRDLSRQIHRLSIPLDDETLMITELLLAESARRVCIASQNPDYEYLPNPDDKFENQKDLLDFWQKKKTGFYDDWKNLTPVQKKILDQKKAKKRLVGYSKIPSGVSKTFGQKAKQFIDFNLSSMNLPPSKKVENVLRVLGKPARVHDIIEGYAADTYLLVAGGGVSVRSIMNAKMDIACAIGVESVLIYDRLIVKDGSSFIGVDVPRTAKTRRFASKIPTATENGIPIGISNFGENVYWKLNSPSSPHLLIAGATGSGKSVLLKNLIKTSKIMGYKQIIIDPKIEFDGISLTAEIESTINDLVNQMNRLYVEKKKEKIMLFIDEVSDLFANEKKAKKNEDSKTMSENVLILSQKARAAGIHIVMASQRFSTKIMSGDIKANFATRVALTCSSAVDSRVMLDCDDASELVGDGDAIFVSPQLKNPTRIQCFK